jgi:hypothetical protein
MGDPRERCSYHYADTPKNQDLARVGVQCGATAESNGTHRCKFHGGRNPILVNKARIEAVRREMTADIATGRFTGLWPSDHELLDPFSLLLWEIRRCGWRIEWYDAKIRELQQEKDIWWGITKEEQVGATEFVGTNRTFEARENILVKMQNEERKRLFDLTKEWQGNKFEAARIAGMGAFATATRAMIHALAAELGLDLADPEIQGVIERVLLGQPPLVIEQH